MNGSRPDVGYQLRRQLRVALGPKVVGLARLVALEIADDANDTTRISRASLDQLADWTAARGQKAVRDALARLADDGWEFRVAITTGTDGRPVYAARGHALTFRVPPIPTEGPTGVGPMDPMKGRTESALSDTKGRLQSRKGRLESPKGPTPVGPLSSVPLSSPHLSLARQVAQLLTTGGVTADEREIADLIEWAKTTHKARGIGWWRTVAANGDLPDRVAEWRAQRPEPRAAIPPWCGECGDPSDLSQAARNNVRFRRTDRGDGDLCPRCHPDALPASA